jgi:OmpA-OmpF porin, OOP family
MRIMRSFHAFIACAAVVVASSLALPEARAGGAGIALDQLDPAPVGDAFVGVPSPFARGNWVVRASLMFDYASQPLKLTPDGGGPSAMVVSRQGFFDLNASLTIQDRLLFSVLLPGAITQNGDNPIVGRTILASPKGPQIGDLRLGLRVRMIGDDEDPFQLGLGANLYVPTAPDSSFAGEGAVRVEPQLIAGGRFNAGVPWVYSAFGAVMVRPSHNPSMIVYGAGIALSLWNDRLQLGPELYASTPIQGSTFTLTDTLKISSNTSTNAELLFGAKVRMWKELFAGWAIGPGLTQALGTPEVRFVGTFGWAPGLPRVSATHGDSDGDGIPDLIDACPYAFGPKSDDPKKNGCPVLDDDEDGIPNDQDACPTRWGMRSSDPKKNGCPPVSATPAPVERPR